MEDKNTREAASGLTEQEERFCYLFVHGGPRFAGQREKCYREIFGDREKNISPASRRLLTEPHILEQVKELAGPLQAETETLAVKLQVTETLKAVMEETATARFSDKFGICLSPAPLRAVSVNAAKALMELYPIRHAQETKLRIEGANGGVTFNVIVPEIKLAENEG